MLRLTRILCIAHALAACAAMLVGCGQKGPLVLPQTPESQGRATLPQTLNPWRSRPDAASRPTPPASAEREPTPAPPETELEYRR